MSKATATSNRLHMLKRRREKTTKFMLSEQPVTHSCHSLSFLHRYSINMHIEVDVRRSEYLPFVLINSNEDSQVTRLPFFVRLPTMLNTLRKGYSLSSSSMWHLDKLRVTFDCSPISSSLSLSLHHSVFLLVEVS
jgi:hypothetical protein